MISGSEWIRQSLKENSYDEQKVYKLFSEFLKETGSSMDFDSFKGTVRSIKSKVAKKVDLENSPTVEIKNTEPTVKIDENILIEILDNYVEQNNVKLSTRDLELLAVSKNFPKNSFFTIPNLYERLEFIYRSHSMYVKQKVDTNKLQEEVRILKAENKMLISQEATFQQFANILKEAVKEYKPYNTPDLRIKSKHGPKTALMMISDIHAGQKINPDDVLGMNSYSILIAKQRLDTYFEKAIANAKELSADELVLLLGGDFVDGIIHDETIRNAEVTVVRQIIEISDYLAQHIRNLTKYFRSIRVVTQVGNHGRILHGKPYNADYAELNFETLIYSSIKDKINACVDEFVLPVGIFSVFKIYGEEYCLTHGHIFKSGGNGFSIIPNTIPRDIAKLQGAPPLKNVKAFYMGHFHFPFKSASFMGNTPIYVNGSVCGSNAYSFNNFKMISPPQQMFQIFEETIGVKYHSDILLD